MGHSGGLEEAWQGSAGPKAQGAAVAEAGVGLEAAWREGAAAGAAEQQGHEAARVSMVVQGVTVTRVDGLVLSISSVVLFECSGCSGVQCSEILSFSSFGLNMGMILV